MSIFGAMFAPDQEKTAGRAAAGDQARRPDRDGQLGPDGGVGQDVRDDRQAHRRPAARDRSRRSLWGTEERLRELFGDGISELRIERLTSRQVFHSADHYIDFFRPYFGPIKTAYEQVGPEGEAALTADLRGCLEGRTSAGDRPW